MNDQELLYAIALANLKGLSVLNARVLLETLGSAGEVFAHRRDIVGVIPDASKRLLDAFADVDDALKVAERELEFVERKHLRVLMLNDGDYPWRLRECEDAPLVLFACGDVDLNVAHVVSVVGTRGCSEYGRDVCGQFVADLKQYDPNVLVVSGLAYGIDICAHRAALESGVRTVGVLAHGLDRIYPSVHRSTAAEMVRNHGGLLTEYTTGNQPVKGNFVRRNRLVAGLCDACVVVESAEKGGSLLTADLALSYNRDVFAFPGRVHDELSVGCNHLIRRHQAALLTGVEDFVEAMGWCSPSFAKKKKVQAEQQELFVDLTEEERVLVDVLKKADDKHINQIAIDSNMPCPRASMLLFELEMKGVVKALGGARFRLVRKGV